MTAGRMAAAWGLAVLAPALLAAAPAFAAAIAFDDPRLQAPSSLSVTIPGLAPGAPLPANYTARGRNVSPPLAWTGGAPGGAGYVLVMQDAGGGAVHWLAYAIPPGLAALPRGLKNLAVLHTPPGVLQGENFHASYGYSGPRPPPGDPPHSYRIQLFELAVPIRLKPGADLAALERVMAGRVRARGELVVADPPAPAPAAPATSTPPPMRGPG